MRLHIKIAIGFLFIVGLILLLLPLSVFPAFYDVRYMGIFTVAGILMIYFAPKYFRVPPQTPNADRKNRAVDLFQSLLTIAILGNALGDLGLYQLYKVGFEFDKLIHFLIPLVCIAFLPTLLQMRFDVSASYALTFSTLLLLLLAIGWEVGEYFADRFLQTHIFGVYGLNVSDDTQVDLFADALGLVVGICLSKIHPKFMKKFF